jgi:elongation factor Ts
VAKNDDFIELANELAKIAQVKGIEEMKKISDGIINPVVQKVGEKIELGVIEEILGNTLGSYVHNNKSAVVVSLTGGTTELAKDIAMHIAAMKPVYATNAEITDEEKAKVGTVFKKEVEESDKAPEIKAKMLEGKISTYFKEQTLVDQAFIKDPNKTIGNLLKENNASLVSFVRQSIV